MGEPARPHNEHLGYDGAIEGRPEQRVNQDARALGAKSQQEDTVVGHRKRQQDRRPSGPAMDNVIEASLGWEAEQLEAFGQTAKNYLVGSQAVGLAVSPTKRNF